MKSAITMLLASLFASTAATGRDVVIDFEDVTADAKVRPDQYAAQGLGAKNLLTQSQFSNMGKS